MRNYVRCVGMFLFLTTFAAAQAATNSPDPAASVSAKAGASQITKLENRLAEALMHRNASFLQQALSSQLIQVAFDGLVFTKARILQDLKNVNISKYQIKNIKYRPLGPRSALITYDLVTDGDISGQKLPSKQYASSVWVKHGNRWQLVLHQTTPATHP